ncbi:MAG: LysR family transcriptional regulator [Eubacterium sp.]
MDIQKVKVFLSAIDRGSLSKAANAFGYTPSGVSHMMQALEEEIGFPLFVRSRKGILPTDDALRILPGMRKLCAQHAEVELQAEEIRDMDRGSVNIASYSSIASQWLPAVIAKFHRDFPNIKINLREGVWQEVSNYLIEKWADLGFYSYRSTVRSRWIPLKEDRMMAALPPGHPLADRKSVSLDELKDETFIMPAFGMDLDVMDVLKDADIRLNSMITTLENYSAIGLVEEGAGVLITQELVTRGRTNKISLLPLDPPMNIELGIAIPNETEMRPPVRTFVRYARDIICS